MKIIARILVILVVIAVVAGGMFLLVENTNVSAQGFEPGLEREGEFESRPFAPPPGVEGRPQRGHFREGHEEGGVSLGRGLGGVLVNLFQIGVVTAIIVLVQKLMTKRKRATI